MKKKIYRVLTLALSTGMLLSICTPVMAANDTTEIFQKSTEENVEEMLVEKNVWKGKVEEKNRIYLDEEGEKVTGLRKIENKFYFFDAEGVVQTDWQKVDDEEYYFSPETGERYENW